MKVLIGFEYSGVERDAMTALGHDAMSCDILPTESPGKHYQGDIRDVLYDGWADLAILHPPCTYMTNSANGSLEKRELSKKPGVLTGPDRWKELIDSAVFFRQLLDAPVPQLAIENPIMNGYAKKIIGRRQDQTVQPWMFGHTEQKAICLWLNNLPPLVATDDVRDIMRGLPKSETQRIFYASPGEDRGKARSLSYSGVAEAMALQWAGDAREAAVA
jgi:hypothetical protein